MNKLDERIYRTFEEFEREELRRMDRVGTSVEDMMVSAYSEELDFEPGAARGRGRRAARHEPADEE